MKTAAQLRADIDLYGCYCAKHTLTAQAHGRSAAVREFTLMLNPKYRGPAFRWEHLESLAVEAAVASAYQPFSARVWRKYQALIEEDVACSARIAARQLVKDSGVATWLPLAPACTKGTKT